MQQPPSPHTVHTQVQFLAALLQRDPLKRLGCLPGVEEDIRTHEYFTNSTGQHDFHPGDSSHLAT